MAKQKWDWITSEMFQEAVHAQAADAGLEFVLGLPGVWEIISEEFNNSALEHCADEAERCRSCGADNLDDESNCRTCDGG